MSHVIPLAEFSSEDGTVRELSYKEFRRICGACRGAAVHRLIPRIFRKTLVERLADRDPDLSSKVMELTDAEARVLWVYVRNYFAKIK